MQANLEQIKEMVKTLPVEDLDELKKTIAEQQKAKQAKNGNKSDTDRRLERYKKARRWLDENGEKYMNQWVCLDGDRLVAHSKDGREVYQKAKEARIKIPFVHFIEEEPEAYWGGWI